MLDDEAANDRLLAAVEYQPPPLDEDPVAMMLGIVKPYCNLGNGNPLAKGYTVKVGLRRPGIECADCWITDQSCTHPELALREIRNARQPAAARRVDLDDWIEETRVAFDGEFRAAMERPIDHGVINGRRSLCEMNGCYVHRGFDGLDWCERHKAYAVTDPDDYDQIPDDGPLDALAERQRRRDESDPIGEECGAIDIANCAVHGYGGTSDLRGPRARPLPVPKREPATYELPDDARPCCHTTGPSHHPACQEAQ